MDKTYVQDLIDAGVHFGHKISRWNPKMKPYIFCERKPIHIINVKETLKGLLRSKQLLISVVSSGQDVLFVGTKRQARQPITSHAKECGMHYVTERWLGGTLTNFRTIRSRLGRLEELEAMEADGKLGLESKKMQSKLRRELRKIKRNLDGVRKMDRLPGLLVAVDSKREHIAISEANKLGIPAVSLIDTDSDPDKIDFPIPCNDDAMKVIDLILRELAEAVMVGKARHVETVRIAEADKTTEVKRRSSRLSTAQAAEAMVEGGVIPNEGQESPAAAEEVSVEAEAAPKEGQASGGESVAVQSEETSSAPAGESAKAVSGSEESSEGK